MIAWPYPKLTVANPAVNQAAVVLLTSLAVARAAGIPDRHLVFPHTGAAAQEPRDWMARPRLDESPAQDAVLWAMGRAAGAGGFDIVELYTCFPVVPKMARRTLGLPITAPISVTGGLTFHGAPLNNFMTHAAAAAVRRLRDGGGERGLLYGQGGHLTAHHALLLGRQAVSPGAMLAPSDVNPATRPPPPAVSAAATGPARLESFTVLFHPDGTVARGAAVLRLPDGARTLGTVPAEDTGTLGLLMASHRTAVGHEGRLTRDGEGLNRWTA